MWLKARQLADVSGWKGPSKPPLFQVDAPRDAVQSGRPTV